MFFFRLASFSVAEGATGSGNAEEKYYEEEKEKRETRFFGCFVSGWVCVDA